MEWPPWWHSILNFKMEWYFKHMCHFILNFKIKFHICWHFILNFKMEWSPWWHSILNFKMEWNSLWNCILNFTMDLFAIVAYCLVCCWVFLYMYCFFLYMLSVFKCLCAVVCVLFGLFVCWFMCFIFGFWQCHALQPLLSAVQQLYSRIATATTQNTSPRLLAWRTSKRRLARRLLRSHFGSRSF